MKQIDYNSITILDKIGEGSGGSIFNICIYNNCKYISKLIKYKTNEYKYIINEIECHKVLYKKFPNNIPKFTTYAEIEISNKKYIIIIMEYLKSYITLSNFICNNKTNKKINIENILKQISNFISKINNNKIIHGDLHADNILINPKNNKFYFIDFGMTVNFNKKNPINIYNININLLHSLDRYRLVDDLYNRFNLSDNILQFLLIPNINKYLKHYELINDPNNIWYTDI